MTSAPATKDDLEAAAHRLRDQLRNDLDRLRLEIRGDLERALRRQMWQMLGGGVAIAGVVVALARL